ncbi:FAD-dependent monooxygenase [Amycolatopsis sp. NPDC058278]|uniref:FAD-dependent monooxygenase n=1 Tax=Amycolatopsis sp. NPDC058278 TaxID=3346417 RepID=UPI0036D82B51
MSRVIVVGAGPTGLMLACELRVAGVETVLLERLPEPTGQSRALALHARSAEVLDQRGLLGPFLADGVTWPRVHYAGLLLDMDVVDGRHRYSLHIHQSRVERLLEEAALKLGADIRRGHAVTGLTQDDDGVTALVSGPDGDYRLPGAFLAGCDGGGSAIRKLAGIGFPGTDSALWGIVGDVEEFDDEINLREPIVSERGMLGVSPLGDGLFRVMCVEHGVTPGEQPVTVAELRAAVERVTGRAPAFGEPRWLSRFGDATRQAERYRAGRVFLAGDAAHIHFPLGAQGMNLGLQDAVNLGWKLAAAVAGWAPPGLLDSYHDERHPVGHQVCESARAQIALTFPADRVSPLRALMGDLLGFADVRRFLAGLVSGVDIRYSPGTTGSLTGARIPDVPLSTAEGESSTLRTLHQARGVLLDLSGGAGPASAAPWAGRVDVVTAAPAAELPYAALLIRPDGHVAWTDRDGTELVPALRRWFGEPAGVAV